jgi:cytochrome c-type biogenesis protein CcmH
MIWVLLIVLAAISSWFVIRPLLQSEDEQEASSSSLEVYRSQLVEVDADLARGIISTAEADAARVEIKRRILNIEEAPDRVSGPHVSRTMAVAAGVVCAGVAAMLYAQLGHPLLPGKPYSLQQEQAAVSEAATNELDAMIAKLTSHLATSPEDLQGWRALGWAQMQTGRTAEGVKALARAAELAPKDASVLSMYGEALVREADGKVTPQALAVFERVIAVEPADPRARYYKGLQLMQDGKLKEAFEIWVVVIKESPPDAEWLPSIREQTRELAVKINVDPKSVP